MDAPMTGGCVCGAARFEARGQPYRVGLCHCLRCRKSHGAPFNAFAVFPRTAVSFLNSVGEALDLGELGAFATSKEGRQHFCRICGSPMFHADVGVDEVEIFLGSLDEPNRLSPTYETFTPRRERWIAELSGLARHYTGNREGFGRTEP